MPRIITPPDVDYDRSPRVLVRNCIWTHEEIIEVLKHLSDKPYDIYLYHDSMNDPQWFEGIRSMSAKVIDCRHLKDGDPVAWLRKLDDEF